VLGEKFLLKLGEATDRTCKVALAGELFFWFWSLVKALAGIVLIEFPCAIVVILTEMLHWPSVVPTLRPTVPPDKEKEFVPGLAVIIPPQLLTTLAGFAIAIPVGKLSVTAAFVNSVVLELYSTTVKVELSPGLIVDGEKDLLRDTT
jgi:hypothetical protein